MHLYTNSAHRSRGSILVETTLAFTAITILSMLLLKASANATTAQRWTVVQGMTDAFMTRELAVAQRIPFDDFKTVGSAWPIYPDVAEEVVEIGKLPGGVSLTGTVTRTRQPSSNNLATEGGTGDDNSNPVRMEAWKLQSFLVYTVGQGEYVKSRTTLRVR